MNRTGILAAAAAILLAGCVSIESSPIAGDDREGQILEVLEDMAESQGRGKRNVSQEDGRLLRLLTETTGATHVVEIGTSNGYSALWLGLAFKETGGKLITIEIEPQRAREAQENFEHAELQNVIESRVNDALKEIPELDEKFDFVFIDAWKPDYMKYLELVMPKMKPGGVITAHNVSSQGGTMRGFLEEINTNPRMKTTIDRSSRAGVSITFIKR